ncbi:MAG: DUF2179 domain-containing protein [Firmicutes bacterium]|nr:DUF2179 domain-containing protein [Bacillota bacterium]
MPDMSAIMHSDLYTWVILPALIFLARIMDVTIGTIRIIYVSRGEKVLAPILGAFEVLIWLMAIGQIMQNLSNVFCYLAYAGGYATGNYVGILLEEKLAMGLLVVRIITDKNPSGLRDSIVNAGYGYTALNAEGNVGNVNILLTVIRRKDLNNLIDAIHNFDPKTFYSVEDCKSAHAAIMPFKRSYSNAIAAVSR